MGKNDAAGADSTSMHYDSGMAPPNKARPGNHSKSGQTQTTRGASVRSGLSMQKGFSDEGNHETGHCTKGRNQRPIHPQHSLNTDRGDFTCY